MAHEGRGLAQSKRRGHATVCPQQERVYLSASRWCVRDATVSVFRSTGHVVLRSLIHLVMPGG